MARTITIIYHHDPECWWAESPDLKRYKAVANKLEELRDMIHGELPEFLGEEIKIVENLGEYRKQEQGAA